MKTCKDCALERKPRRRKARYPGPRCYSHYQAVQRERKQVSRASYIERTYSITEDQYQELYRAQGGTCAICARATGKGKRRLSVDHDHACCAGRTSCGRCVRGLLCRKCNRDVLGHLRDSVDALQRAINYLKRPPARRIIS